MAREILHRSGTIERIPDPEELDQKTLPGLNAEILREVKQEIDALWEAIGQKQRADQAWESDAKVQALKDEKQRLVDILNNRGRGR